MRFTEDQNEYPSRLQCTRRKDTFHAEYSSHTCHQPLTAFHGWPVYILCNLCLFLLSSEALALALRDIFSISLVMYPLLECLIHPIYFNSIFLVFVADDKLLRSPGRQRSSGFASTHTKLQCIEACEIQQVSRCKLLLCIQESGHLFFSIFVRSIYSYDTKKWL